MHIVSSEKYDDEWTAVPGSLTKQVGNAHGHTQHGYIHAGRSTVSPVEAGHKLATIQGN